MKIIELFNSGVEVLQTDNELIICGSPSGELYESHNCDEMGCSSVSHVLLRIPITNNILGLPKQEPTNDKD